ncbi:MAG: hypothetical protein ACQR33_02745 [Candidatus Saccharibacteria bacterium]
MDVLTYAYSVHILLVVASGVLAIISPIVYGISIIRGSSRPHRITRFALCAVLILNLCSVIAAHGNLSTLVIAYVFAIQAFVIFGLSIWKGVGGRSALDWICLAIAAIGVILWQTSGNPVVAIWCSILADASAYTPAVIKTWRDPSSESHWTFTTGLASLVLSLLAYRLSIASAFQVYLLLMDGAMMLCIFREQIPGLRKPAEPQVDVP